MDKDKHIAKLGDVIQDLMASSLRPEKSYLEEIMQAWSEVVPLNLQRQCRLLGMKHGVLQVIVSSPSYLFELQLCQQELLHHLQQACSSVRLKQIKYRLG